MTTESKPSDSTPGKTIAEVIVISTGTAITDILKTTEDAMKKSLTFLITTGNRTGTAFILYEIAEVKFMRMMITDLR